MQKTVKTRARTAETNTGTSGTNAIPITAPAKPTAPIKPTAPTKLNASTASITYTPIAHKHTSNDMTSKDKHITQESKNISKKDIRNNNQEFKKQEILKPDNKTKLNTGYTKGKPFQRNKIGNIIWPEDENGQLDLEKIQDGFDIIMFEKKGVCSYKIRVGNEIIYADDDRFEAEKIKRIKQIRTECKNNGGRVKLLGELGLYTIIRKMGNFFEVAKAFMPELADDRTKPDTKATKANIITEVKMGKIIVKKDGNGNILWLNENNARAVVEHIFEKHVGLTKDLPQKIKLQLIREKILYYKNNNENIENTGNKIPGPNMFIQDFGLTFITKKVRKMLKTYFGAYALLKWYDADLVDDTQEDYIKISELKTKKKNDKSKERIKYKLIRKLETNDAKTKINRKLEMFGYPRINSQQIEKRIFIEKIINAKGGVILFLDENSITELIPEEIGYQKSRNVIDFFKWFFEESPGLSEIIKQIYCAHMHELEYKIYGKKYFKDIVLSQNIPSVLLNQHFIYNRWTNPFHIHNNSQRLVPQVVSEQNNTYENDELIFVETIVNVYPFLSSIKLTNEKRNGEIKKFIPVCKNLILIVGQYYHPELHDETIQKLKQEYHKYRTSNEQNLRIVFADEITKMYKTTDSTGKKAIEKFAETVEYNYYKRSRIPKILRM